MSKPCEICRGAIPDGEETEGHTALCAAVVAGRARAEALDAAAKAVRRLMRGRDPIYTHDLQQAVDAILALQAGKGSGR